MGDIVFGHGEDRDLGDGTFFAFDAASAFVDGGEVGVEVARITAATRDFFTSGGDFAERFTVVGHVG